MPLEPGAPPGCLFIIMHILYADIAGNTGNTGEKHLIMAGVAVHETAIFHVMRELDETVARHLGMDVAEVAGIELHGTELRTGKRFWRRMPRGDREALMHDALSVLKGPSKHNLRAFGMVMDKVAVSPEDPVEHAFEQLCSRFDLFLKRMYRRTGQPQRGLLVLDEDKYERPLQTLAGDYRTGGTRWGNLRNLAEVPLFVDSRASRLIQLADLVSYALWRRYEHGDAAWIAPIIGTFDNDGGVYHGLYHKRLPQNACDCPACACRASE